MNTSGAIFAQCGKPGTMLKPEPGTHQVATGRAPIPAGGWSEVELDKQSGPH